MADVFIERNPRLLQDLLLKNGDLMQLQMTLVNGFLAFCTRNSLHPSSVKIVDFSFDDRALPLPTIKWRFVKSLDPKPKLELAHNRKYATDLKINATDNQLDNEWTRDVRKAMATCVEENQQLYDTLVNLALVIKKYCDHKQYAFETVRIDPSHPPILTPFDDTVKICLEVVGKVMAPTPTELQGAGSGI